MPDFHTTCPGKLGTCFQRTASEQQIPRAVSEIRFDLARRIHDVMDVAGALEEARDDLSLFLGKGGPMSEREKGPSRIVFGTVVRTAPIEEGGELVVLDWETKEVEARTPIMPRNPAVEADPNPRGNARGCRGIRYHDGRIIASTYHTLEVYDEALRLQDRISDGLMVALHEIEVTRGSTVWVSSTAIDAAVEYDLSSKERRAAHWPREMKSLQETLGLEPLDIDKTADNRLQFLDLGEDESHLHLNAVDVYEGRIYALCNAFGCVVDLTRREIVLQHESLEGGHNLDITDDGLAISNDTYGRAVCFFDLSSGALRRRIKLTDFQWVRELIRSDIPRYWGREGARLLGFSEGSTARPLFVRGLARAGDTLLVGVSPAAVLQVNWKTEELVDAYQYSSDVQECIHGLAVLD